MNGQDDIFADARFVSTDRNVAYDLYNFQRRRAAKGSQNANVPWIVLRRGAASERALGQTQGPTRPSPPCNTSEGLASRPVTPF